MITYAIALTIYLATGAVVSATSLPETWPTQEACEAEAQKVKAFVMQDRGYEEGQVKVHCFRAIVDQGEEVK